EAVADRRSYQETKAVPASEQTQGIKRRAAAAVFTRIPGRNVRPPSLESATIMSSLPLADAVAQATYTWFESTGSTDTVGLLRMLPLLHRSSPGIGQGALLKVVTCTEGCAASPAS